MTFFDFFKDRFYVLLLNLICAVCLTLFLQVAGIGTGELVLILLCWFIILLLNMGINYARRKKESIIYNNLLETLDKKYLLPEIMERPRTLEGRLYFMLMRHALKSMTEHVSKAEQKQVEYKEFVEQWIHEVKVPITAIKLICENNKSELTRKILSQTEQIDGYTERALYYARMGHVEKDYLVKETVLNDIVQTVLFQNKQLLIQSKVQVQTFDLHHTVYTDKKWITFILSQIIVNAIKYKKKSPVIKIKANERKKNVMLSITDNGIGIKESELGRIFEKGFTGSNGRNIGNSSGIGLYLCKELSLKLGIRIEAKSEFNEYTTIILQFPKNSSLKH